MPENIKSTAERDHHHFVFHCWQGKESNTKPQLVVRPHDDTGSLQIRPWIPPVPDDGMNHHHHSHNSLTKHYRHLSSNSADHLNYTLKEEFIGSPHAVFAHPIPHQCNVAKVPEKTQPQEQLEDNSESDPMTDSETTVRTSSTAVVNTCSLQLLILLHPLVSY